MKLITGYEIRKSLQNAYACLSNEKEQIDALNVFPVPDGDTGTNMLLTFTSGIEAINAINEDNISVVLKAFSRGLLMGARGNSGVILSQIFRGFSKAVESKDAINALDVIEAFIEARETAYKAVMNPVEGTILTVISDVASDLAKYQNNENISDILALAVEAGNKSLENTPNLLPVLKEAGVVDSGGYGLMVILTGIRDYFNGELTTISKPVQVFDSADLTNESTEFGYCTEFIFSLDEERSKKNKFSEDKLKQQLSKLGDSLVVVHDEDIVKVHVHTLVPGEALNIGQMYGEFIKLKIENMTLQHEEILNFKSQELEPYSIISVSSGTGISALFKENGATSIVDGGQTMNPSTNDFVELINSLNVANVLILPNNSNIIMSANQAKQIIEESTDVKVEVVPTKSIIQGLAALSFFNVNADISVNLEEMISAYDEVKYGEITYAVRNTVMNDVTITEGEYISIFDKNIISSKIDKVEAFTTLIDSMVDETTSLITLIYGKDVTTDELEKVCDYLSVKYSSYEVEVHKGEQDVYSFFVGVE